MHERVVCSLAFEKTVTYPYVSTTVSFFRKKKYFLNYQMTEWQLEYIKIHEKRRIDIIFYENGTIEYHV